MPRLRLLLALGSLAAVALLGGCGGSDGDPDEPAALVPPDAALYAQAVVSPRGELASEAEESLRKLTGERDPGATITEFLDDELREQDPGLSFEADIEPWLGERAALFFVDLDELEGAFLIQTSDPGAAERFAREVTEDGAREESYEGEAYLADSDDTAAGVVGEFLVFGDEVGVKAAIDAAEGDSLADEEAFDEALDAAPEGSLIDAYVSLDAVAAGAASELGAESSAFYDGLLGGTEGEAVAASLVPRGDVVELELSSDAFEGLDPGTAGELVAALPAEAWAAAAIPDAEAFLRGILRGVESTGRLSIAELESALGFVGIDVEADLLRPIEGVAGFLQSGGIEPIGGAVLISSSDGEATGEAVQSIGSLLERSGDARPATIGGERGFSVSVEEIGTEPLYVVPGDDEVVIGYGRSATERALAGGDGLSASPEYSAAAEALGADPVAFVTVPEGLRVADAFGYLSDPDLAAALPFLERVRYLAAGVESGDGRGAFRFVAGLQP